MKELVETSGRISSHFWRQAKYLVHNQPGFDGQCQVRVYSGRGSGQVRTKADEGEGQRAGQGISPAGVETDWIQRQGGRALIPCVGSGQGDGVGDGGGDRQRLE